MSHGPGPITVTESLSPTRTRRTLVTQARRPGTGIPPRPRPETRADSANVTRNPRGTAQGSPQPESDSESGGGPCADRLHLLCPGCNKSFATISSLRRHRNSWWMTDPSESCRAAAGSQLKKPRTVTVRVHDSGTAQDSDAIDRINAGFFAGPL